MKLIILGAGGFGRTVADVAEQMNRYDQILFLDDASDHPCSEYENYKFDYIYPAFGDNTTRLFWVEKLFQEGCKVPTIIHPSAYISPKAVVKTGTVVLPNAVINTDTIIEEACIINLSAVIDHGCIIEKGCHICLGAVIKGENRINKLTKIEAGEIIQARMFPI